MKSLNQYIQEKLIINKDYRDNKIIVKSFDELRKIIEDRYKKLGPGTEQNPIDFNDIDVSNLDSLCKKYKYTCIGIFAETKFKYIDISEWDVSNVTNMYGMFLNCKFFNQDISKWDVSKVSNMSFIFGSCESFNQDLSSWNVSKVTNMEYMFYNCKSFNQDISKWDVSKVRYKIDMFLIAQ